MKIKLLDLEGNPIKDLTVKKLEEKEGIYENLLRYIKVYLANQHQGTAHTKTRAEVRGGGKKPWAQKHTGKARAGSRRSPIWVGGGIAHGPRSKNISFKVDKQVKKDALMASLSEKAVQGKFSAVSFETVTTPKSKLINEFFKKIKATKLLIIHDSNDMVFKSARNIPNIEALTVNDFNPFNIVSATNVVIEEKAVSKLEDRL